MINETQIKQSRSLFISQLKSIAPVNYEATLCLFNALNVLEIEKRKVLSAKDQRLDKVYFVASGLVEAFYISENGKKVIHKIYKPGDFIFDYQSHLDNKPSQITYKTINDCQLVYFKFDELKEIVQENPELWVHASQIVMKELLFMQNRSIAAHCEDTTTRYQNFLSTFSGFTTQISSKKVSEYLGVTEQGLHKAKRKADFKEEVSLEIGFAS